MENGNTDGVGPADGLRAELEAAVTTGAPGEQLPSVRTLMARHRAGPATVQRAIGELAARGLVEARPGRGTFIAARRAASGASDYGWQTVSLGARAIEAEALDELLRPPPAGALVLSSGYLPPDLQPRAALAAAYGRAARRPEAWDRLPPEGIAGLRAHFAAAAGGAVTPADVLVCPGGQAALAACLRGLTGPGSAVLVESPTYLGALVAARAQGLRPVPVPTDRDGVRPDLLADAFMRTGARLFYCQPAFANPHGATLASERRAAVLEAVGDAGAFLIEDDAVRDLHLGAAPPPPPLLHADADGHVVYLRSLTKPASAGLRVAALIARGPAAERLRAARMVEDLFVPGALQEAALELLGAPAWRRHLTRLRGELRERRDALLMAVSEWLGPGRTAGPPPGGMHLWAELDPHEDDRGLTAAAARSGVVVSAGRPFFAAEPPAPFLRLTYAAEPPERLGEGIRLLAAARS